MCFDLGLLQPLEAHVMGRSYYFEELTQSFGKKTLGASDLQVEKGGVAWLNALVCQKRPCIGDLHGVGCSLCDGTVSQLSQESTLDFAWIASL